MVGRFGGAGNATAGGVAAGALGGCTFKNSLHVTVLAFLPGMHAIQRETGFQVIEVCAMFGFRPGIIYSPR